MGIFYWAIWLALVLISALESFSKFNKKTIKYLCASVVVILIFVSSIRWDSDVNDWIQYYLFFNRNPPKNLIDVFLGREVYSFEPLYYVLARLVKYLFDEYAIVQFLMAMLSVGLWYSSIVYFSENKKYRNEDYGSLKTSIAIPLLLAWSVSLMEIYQIRSSVAYAMCIYSIRFVEKKDIKKFIIMIVLATGFHFSAIVFIPAYWLYHMKFNTKTILKFALVFGLISFIGIDKVLSLAGLLGGRYENKVAGYNEYVSADNFVGFNYSGIFIIIRAISNTILIFIIILYIKKFYGIKDKRENGLINLYYFGGLLQIITLTYNYKIARLALPFIQLQYFLFPLPFYHSRYNKILFFLVIVAYSGLRLYSVLSGYDPYFDFHTIFSR